MIVRLLATNQIRFTVDCRLWTIDDYPHQKRFKINLVASYYFFDDFKNYTNLQENYLINKINRILDFNPFFKFQSFKNRKIKPYEFP